MTITAFGRSAKLQIYTANKENYWGTQGNAVEIATSLYAPGLRITARVERHTGKEPNTAEVSITNVDPDTRAFFAERPLIVRVLAGYQDSLRLLFTGDVRHVVPPIRSGADLVTTFQLADGGRAYAQAKLRKSYKRGTTVATAVADVAQSMGLKLSPLVSAELQEEFTNGYITTDAAADELTALLEPFNFTWSIQNGQLQVLRLDKAQPGEALVITDVIGQVEIVAPDSTKKAFKPPVMKCRTVLNPDVLAGGLIRLQTDSFQGTFKVKQAVDVLDTHGQDWATEIEGTPIR